MFLFGNMTSSNAIVASVHTTITVPSGVMVNYSSTPGATSGLCKLRSGVIVSSGTVLLPASDFDFSTYDVASRTLTINMLNSSRLPLKGSQTGSGAEIAKINFDLVSPGTSPAISLKDTHATIGMEMLQNHDVVGASGGVINFDSSL